MPGTEPVTFFFTDIEGSTKLWEAHPDGMRLALARHDALLYAAIAAHGGRVFKTVGDAFHAVFANVTDALGAALDAQRALGAEAWGETGPLQSRMAVHCGQAEALPNGDYSGPALNRIARLLVAGHGGQTLVSQAANERLGANLPNEASLLPLGVYRLKDLQRAEPVYQLNHPGLPPTFPSLRSLEAFAHNLPPQLTSFIGREREMEEFTQLLAATRLLTLTGTGGTGKSRLALQMAAEVVDTVAGGVWLVELAAVTDAALVWRQVAHTLGVREESGKPLADTLTDYLRPKPMLLLLDNCEHLIEACAQMVERLLRVCPGLALLTTSREALGISGEIARRVPSLALPEALPTGAMRRADPETAARLGQSPAVRLFVERVQSRQPNFDLTPDNAFAVAQIGTRLDGIPLALELAAACIKALTVEEIAAQLDDRFRLLTGGSRTALPRQQTLRAMMDWSYDLLTPEEQTLLRRLSVFVGGWSLEAAEAIAPGGAIEEFDILGLLLRLVDKSLVMVEEGPNGETRYRLLETVRDYSQGRLWESGDSESTRGRHRDWYLALSETTEPLLQSPEQAVWLDRLELEHDNLRAALHWTEDAETRLRIAGPLWRFWYVRGHLSEGREWLESAAEATEVSAPVRAKALNGAGVLAMTQGDFEAARHRYKSVLALRESLGDAAGIARAHNNLGLLALEQGDYETARVHLETALAIKHDLGDTAGCAVTLINLGNNETELGRYAEAQSRFEQSLVIWRQQQHTFNIAISLYNLGEVLFRQQKLGAARDCFTEGLQLQQTLKHRGTIAYALVGLASIAVEERDPIRAAHLFGAAEAAREAVAAPLPASAREQYERSVAQTRTALGEAQFAEAWSEGRRMPLEKAIEKALQATEAGG